MSSIRARQFGLPKKPPQVQKESVQERLRSLNKKTEENAQAWAILKEKRLNFHREENEPRSRTIEEHELELKQWRGKKLPNHIRAAT